MPPRVDPSGVRTQTLPDLADDDLEDEFVCIFPATGPDPRSTLPVWAARQARLPHRCAVITSETPDSVTLRLEGRDNTILLQDANGLARIYRLGTGGYLDITGLSHHVWASLLRVGLDVAPSLRAIYAEPTEYRRHPSPASPSVFYLSDSFRGIAPLPGFARLSGPADETDTILVTFLGFEGMRARQIATSLDPLPKVMPVIGLPGFQADLPNYTVSCNRDFLEETRAFADIRFCQANSPFKAYRVLADIRRDYPDAYMYIAPVGTKPHALGAVLFSIDYPNDTELIYDHPVRSLSRTRGVESVHIYHIK